MFGMFHAFNRRALIAAALAAAALLQAVPGSAQTGPGHPGLPLQDVAPPTLLGAAATDESGVELGTVADAPVRPETETAETAEPTANDIALEPTPVGAPLETDAAGRPETVAEQAVAAPTPLPQALPTSRFSLEKAAATASRFLRDGGPAIWAIAALSVATLALIFWKAWRLALIGAWSRGRAGRAVDAWERGDIPAAQSIVGNRRGLRARVVATALRARLALPDQAAREDTARVAKRELAEAASGLRALELIATIAPLLGLLGTVMGMIAAFQALQQSGSRADPAMLAGGIWEALLTTAAGMAVAIPASAALTWFEAVIDRMRRDVEDAAARIFVTQLGAPRQPAQAAE